MSDNKDFVHFGVRRIAERMQLGQNTTRKLLQAGTVRAYKTETGAWYCIESELNEDIKKIPGKL